MRRGASSSKKMPSVVMMSKLCQMNQVFGRKGGFKKVVSRKLDDPLYLRERSPSTIAYQKTMDLFPAVMCHPTSHLDHKARIIIRQTSLNL